MIWVKVMKLQKLYSYVRRALADYDMIQAGDRIAIGVSGGKDSLALLYALAGMRRFYPVKYEVAAITVDLGYGDFDCSAIEALCKDLDVEYHIVKTQIGQMVSDGQCSLCARLRKGALGQMVRELGCNKIAYAHNNDDVVETMMMSLIYEGRFSAFWPVTVMDGLEEGTEPLTLIRPLIYAPADELVGFKNLYKLPVVKNPCPYDKVTQRSYARQLLKDINSEAPGVKKRMFTAITDGIIPEWKKK